MRVWKGPDNRLRRPGTATFLVVLLVVGGGCRRASEAPVTEPRRSLGELSPATWERLAGQRIYFGHQSVGANVMKGVEELLEANPSIGLRVQSYEGTSELAPGTFAHGRVGSNFDYASKIDGFVDLVDRELGGHVDVAFFKFCFVDITPETDVQQVFDRYTKALSDLARRHPDTIFVHSTVPLTWRQKAPAALVSAAKMQVKRLLGLPIGGAFRNANRNRLNAMLRRHYEGREPIFDIARIESTRADGSRCAWKAGTRYAMAPEYTDDGGHLNAHGRRWVAEQLLIQLAELVKTG